MMIQRTPKTRKRRSKRQASSVQAMPEKTFETTVARLVETLRRPEDEQKVTWAHEVLRGVRSVFSSELNSAADAQARRADESGDVHRQWRDFRNRLNLIESELDLEDNSSPLRAGLRCSLLKTLSRMLKLKRREERHVSTGTRFAFSSDAFQSSVKAAEGRRNGQSF